MGVNAQKVENVRASARGEQIIITYDLTGDTPDQLFKVNLYCSHNNFASPVQQVTGAVGDNILSGKDKRIEWNAKNEIRDFKGDLSFEVHADLIAPIVAPATTLATPTQFIFRALPSVKRGGTLPIYWSGGSSPENVKLELLKKGVAKQTVMNAENIGKYVWSVPPDSKPGTYQLRATSASGTGVSPYFSIRHRIPTLLKALPVVIIVGILALSGSKGGSPTTPTPSDLPPPPNP
jgi:hypothetical protein